MPFKNVICLALHEYCSIYITYPPGYIVLHITIAYVSYLLVESHPPDKHGSPSPKRYEPSGDSKESGMN